jgi:hypothetical protein
MAKKTVVELIDDLDGSPAKTTIAFSWQGTAYEIDLNDKNAKAFAAAIDPYLSRATKAAGSRSGRRAGARRSKSGGDLGEIRAWASANGHRIAARGRIPSSVIDAYRTAHGASGASGSAAARKDGRSAASGARSKTAKAAKAGARGSARSVKRASSGRKTAGRRG